MKLPFKKRNPPAPPRQVAHLGRTNAFAYYAQRSPERAQLGRQIFRETLTARNAQKAATYWLRRFGAFMVVIAIIIGVVSVLGLSTDPKIIAVDDTANRSGYLHSFETYQQAAQKLFGGSILNRNKITLDAGGIAAAMKQEFPELAAVSVSFPLVGHRPLVYVESTKPVLVLATNGKSYVIDEKGRAISELHGASAESLHLVNVQDKSGAAATVGQLALSSNTVAFVQELLFQMQQKHIEISTFVLPAASSELDMHLAGQVYYVKFNLVSQTADQQIGTFLAVRHQLLGKGSGPKQYIDVRVDGRAYYK